MSLSRLLSLRLRLVINTAERRRWCSSVNDKGDISQSLKKSEVVEQQKAMDVSEKKHMTENEEAFPRETHVQKEVGPWNSFVAILQITKKKIFGNLMEQKSSSTEEACITEHQMQIEIPRTSDRGSANKSGLTASEYQEEEIISSGEEIQLHHPTKEISIPPSLSNTKMNKISSVSYNSSHMEAGHRAINQIVSPKSEKSVPKEFDRLHETSQNTSGQSGGIKSLLECIRVLPPQDPSVFRPEDIVVDGSVDRYRERSASNSIQSQISIPPSLSNTKMNKISSVSYNSSHMEAGHRAIDQIVNPKSEKSVPKEFDHLHETSQNTSGQSGGIKSLLECFRVLPPQDPSVFRPEDIVVDGSVDRYRERSASNSIQSQTDKQSVDWKKIKTSSQGVIGKKGGLSNKVVEDLNPGDERAKIRNTASRDFVKSIEAKEKSMRKKGDLNKNEDASLSEMLSAENKMTIKFVNLKATEKDVYDKFKSFGAITKVVFPSVNSTKYKVADIYFESEEGRQKALKSSDVDIMNVVVVDATSPPKGTKRMCVPDIIGYSEVPTSLVKHPSRTVMIKKLTKNMSFHDIEEALAFCRSNITGIFFGSSSSVAYVEFETVEGKETAIEKHSLVILGETLPILRIDAPRTTIVRISNIPPTINKVISFCEELGQTRHFLTRGNGILDVHFKIAEWPRMLEIINRLNGIEVDGQQLVAKPAPVYPPDILNVLWSRPEGRKHLKTTFNSMLLKVGGDAVGLVELVDKFYADVQETKLT